MLRHIVATVYGLAFIWIGIAHFIVPENFAEIVPPLFLFPMFWAYVSGAMEIAGGGNYSPTFTALVNDWDMPILTVILYYLLRTIVQSFSEDDEQAYVNRFWGV